MYQTQYAAFLGSIESITCTPPSCLMRFIPTPRPTYLRNIHCRPAYLSPSSLLLHTRWYRNINLFPIGFAFRLYLRGRLTLPGLSLDRNPWVFGEEDFHPPYRYSCQHSHFQPLQHTLPVHLHRCWNAPLPLLGSLQLR